MNEQYRSASRVVGRRSVIRPSCVRPSDPEAAGGSNPAAAWTSLEKKQLIHGIIGKFSHVRISYAYEIRTRTGKKKIRQVSNTDNPLGINGFFGKIIRRGRTDRGGRGPPPIASAFGDTATTGRPTDVRRTSVGRPSNVRWTSDAWTSIARPSDVRPSDVRPSDVCRTFIRRPSIRRPTDVRRMYVRRPSDVRRIDRCPSDVCGMPVRHPSHVRRTSIRWTSIGRPWDARRTSVIPYVLKIYTTLLIR